jgi:hypothetical protein
MLPLLFGRLGLLGNVHIDQVRASYFTPHQQRDAMQCKVKNLSVPSLLPDGFAQGVSGKDLTNQLRGIGTPITKYVRSPDVDRGKLVLVALKESFESGIRQFDCALPVKDNDSHRAILYKRIQVCSLSI